MKNIKMPDGAMIALNRRRQKLITLLELNKEKVTRHGNLVSKYVRFVGEIEQHIEDIDAAIKKLAV